MLAAGGSAVDAVIAAASMLAIVEPVSNGLGSDAFAILWDGTALHGLNASGAAPAGWDLGYFEGKYGAGGARRPLRGWDTVTVPGAISAWAALHARFGRLPFADLLEPAAEIAERGYAVTPIVAAKWAAAIPGLKDQPGYAAAFMPKGRAPGIGEMFALPDAARTLRRIGETGGRDFYEGEFARRMVEFAREGGGALSLADLAGHRAEWVTPISVPYRGYDLHEIPPNGQGIAALMALGMLDRLDLSALPVDSVESQHLQIEAMKLAFADVYEHVADLRSMRHLPEALLHPDYLASRARLIDPARAQHSPLAARLPAARVYLTAADASGMMVSFIQSNYMGFGSGVVVPGTGISLQNRGYGFSMDPASPNVVTPGRRPFHTIIPAFLTRDGSPVMSFGVMGGDMQPQGHLQTLVRMLDYRQQPQAACDAPRWKVNRDFSIDLESGIAPEVADGLKSLGHRIAAFDDPYMDFGSGQFIWKGEDGYVAASDHRRDGQASGF